ncbi:MAG TPA: hypothetical protein VGG39_23395 [Polyangiaceae bacterium]|jgi:hypothetical protein
MPLAAARSDNVHSTHVAKLLEKLGEEPIKIKDLPISTPGPALREGEPAVETAADPKPGADETESAIERPDATVAAPPDTSEGRASTRLRRSVELERRAEANKKRAREEANRAKQQKAEADARVRTADRRAKALEGHERKLLDLQAKLEAEAEQLKVSPFEFAARHGMGAKEIAEFARAGADPNQRRMDLIEKKFNDRLAEVERSYEKKIGRVAAQITEERVEAAHQHFIEHVASDADRFEALNTIYSQSELLAKANELAERNHHLQLGYDGDKLCEQLEASARKDPRWSRLASHYERKRPSDKKPNAPISSDPNARTKDKGEVEPERPARQRSRTVESTDSHDRVTPEGRHRDRVERIIRTTRWQGF